MKDKKEIFKHLSNIVLDATYDQHVIVLVVGEETTRMEASTNAPAWLKAGVACIENFIETKEKEVAQ